MTSSLTQRLCASALIAHVEKICAAGWLPEPDERHLRVLIETMRTVYGPEMPERKPTIILMEQV